MNETSTPVVERKPRPTTPGGMTDWDLVPELGDSSLTDAALAAMYGVKRTAVTMARLKRGLRRRKKYGDKQYDLS